MRIIVPDYAISLEGTKKFHFQKPQKMNKTICGRIIADGRGWKYRTSRPQRKRKWERKSITEIAPSKMCKICLGAMRATK